MPLAGTDAAQVVLASRSSLAAVSAASRSIVRSSCTIGKASGNRRSASIAHATDSTTKATQTAGFLNIRRV